MIDIEQLKQRLFTVPWDNATKRLVSTLLPKLGQRTLSWLHKMTGDISYAKEEHEDVRAVLLALYDSLGDLSRDGYWQTLAEYLATSTTSSKYGYGKYFIPFILDFKDFAKNRSPLPQEFLQTLLEFEVTMFVNLPEDELNALLQNKLVWLASQVHLTDSFRQARINSIYAYLVEWPKPFIASMEANEEILSEKQILVDGKQVQPLVKHWIRDFAITLNTPTTQRTALDVAQYLQKNVNAQGIDPKRREVLLEILKLYAWLTNTSSFFDEIDGEEPVSIPTPEVPVPGVVRAAQTQPATQTVQRTISVTPEAPPVKPLVPTVPRPKDVRKAVNLQEQLLSAAAPLVDLPPGSGSSGVLPPSFVKSPARVSSVPEALPRKPEKVAVVNPEPVSKKPVSEIPKSASVQNLTLKANIPVAQPSGAVNVQALLSSEHRATVSGSNAGTLPRGVVMGLGGSQLDIEKIKKEIEEKRQSSRTPPSKSEPTAPAP